MSGSPTSIVVVNAASTGGKAITSAVSPTVEITTIPAGRKASVTPVLTYTASMWIWVTRDTSLVSCSIDWSDANHGYLSTNSNNVSVPAGVWTFVTNTYIAPAGVAYANMSCSLAGTPLATDIFYVDDVRLSAGTDPSVNLLSNPGFET